MKFHFPLIDTVVLTLTDIFENNYYADRVIERTLKNNPKMGARDRAFVAETTYDIVRWWRLLNECTETGYKTDRVSLLTIISAYFYLFHNERAQWKENYGVDFQQIRSNYDTKKSNPAILESVPDWLYETGKKELGDQLDQELSAMNKPADVVLRVNTLKITAEELKKELIREEIETEIKPEFSDALFLKKRASVFRSDLFKEGLFEVQDAGSQEIAHFLQPQPGMRVIDACAGAGGKSLHIACLMKNKGRIISMDVEEFKLAELRKRASRNSIGIIETRLIEGTKTIKRLEKSADRLLLDVPCSGTGTLKRNPDAKWKLKEEFIIRIREVQKDILQQYSKMLRPGGIMVYATCSLLPSENEEQVKFFIQNNPDFEFLEEKKLFPSVNGTDGFYMCRMKRKNS